MLITRQTDALQKLEILGEAARYEAVSPAGARPQTGAICRDSGQARKLLRVLQTNECTLGCGYCPLRSQNDQPTRATFSPDELARTYAELQRRNKADGLFLSTGVAAQPDDAVARMVDTAAILRRRYSYTGYIHLKLATGVSKAAVEAAALLADRVSINMEMPNAERLAALAGAHKAFYHDMIRPIEWLREMKRERGLLPSGYTTQFIVGAGGETDKEIMKSAAWLYGDMGLSRVYFSAFRPAANTPLADHPAPLPHRQNRLSQADWLLRNYDFGADELPYTDDGDLPQGVDPKAAWALKHLERFPIEINSADPTELLRVPGIGPISLARIVAFRRDYPFKSLDTFKATGAVVSRARDFITLDGRYFGAPQAMLARAGRAILTAHPTHGTTYAEQLLLPLTMPPENVLPPRQSTSLADYGFD